MNARTSLERLRPTVGFQAGMLALTVMLATLALGLAARSTSEPIARAIAEDTRRSIAQVLPQDSFDNDPGADRIAIRDEGRPVVVHFARKLGKPSAVVLEIGAAGYAGEIALVVGISTEARVLGVRVTRHSETPGLGDKIEVGKSDWIEGFIGADLQQPPPPKWAVKKDGGVFDQFAGATITPRAVVATVRRALELYRRDHQAWFATREPA